jgi:hypothetical protein
VTTLADSLPEDSLDAHSLRALLARWEALRDAASTAERHTASQIEQLAREIVEHRNRLFAANAKLQADAPDDDHAPTVAQLASNQLAIKACTTALTEMVGALGHQSIPA